MANEQFLERAYALHSSDEARSFYDEWGSRYNETLRSFAYTLPKQAVAAFQQNHPNENTETLKILDLACGTGLAGLELAAKGYRNVEGMDISSEMLVDAARCGAYTKLSTADLSKSIDRADGSYDAIICVGTFTPGHLKPSALDEFVRILQPHGLLVATITDKVWEEYQSKMEEMEKNHSIDVVSQQVIGIVDGQASGARIVVLRKRQT